MKKEIKKRAKLLQKHYEDKGVKANALPLDAYQYIGLSVQPCDKHFFPAKFPISMTNEEIIREMDGLMSGRGASVHSVIDFRLHDMQTRLRLPGGAWPL